MADQSTFTLKLYISGLGLFVRDGGDSAGTMHVLLPETRGNPHHEHESYLYFDPKYNGDPNDTRNRVPFSDVSWTIPAAHPPRADLTLPATIPDISRYTKKPLKRDRLKKGKDVLGQLILQAGYVQCWGPGAHWTVGNDTDVAMSNWMLWVIEGINGDQLDLDFEPFQGGPVGLAPLFPRQEDDRGTKEIALHLLYAPHCEHATGNILPPDFPPTNAPPPADAGSHFQQYTKLFDGPASFELRLPKVESLAIRCREQGVIPRKSRLIYTCMLAQSTVE